MAEKNYKTAAVVPEMPRTIDNQQLHIYTPVGSVNNFGVFKPDGDQFVIVDGVLRADASKLIQLANTPAIVVENGGKVGVYIGFTKPDDKLNRKFQFIFENIKGATGATGATGLSALQTTYTWTSVSKPVIDTTSSSQFFNFNRTPVVGDTFIAIYRRLATDLKTILGVYLVYCEITSVDESSTSCNFKLVRFQEIPIKYITQITGPVTEGLNDTYTIAFSDGTTHEFVVTNGAQGPQGEQGPTGAQGPKGNDGVSITSVTQTGVQGGTQVTITLSNGQSTSFVVYNGINTNFQVVDALPTENISTSTIYLVPATTPSADNVYDEYIYVNGDWEHIGSTTIDLSDYVTKTFFNQNVGDATKNYIDAQVAQNVQDNLEAHINDTDNPHKVTKVQVGLGNVNNTSDKNKPISIPQQAALDNKLDKVKTITDNPQVYAKNADGTQGMKEIKGGNGIIVDAASDDKFLEVKVGDTIKIAENQKLTIADSSGLEMVTFKNGIIDFDPQYSDAFTFKIGGENAHTSMTNNYGPNIKVHDIVIGDNGDVGAAFYGLNMYYEITGVPTSSTSGTLPDNQSWIILQIRPQDLRILFNNEFYQLADNQHTNGKLVYSHVTYESGQLIIKTITITIATRGWVLTTVKPSEAAYHIELADSDSGGTLTPEQYNALLADKNSYILLENGPIFKLTRALTSADDAMQYTNVTGNITRYVSITSAGVWTFGSYSIETTSNKTTSLSASSTNTQYPSAAATYTYGQTVLNDAKSYTDTAIANAITTALNTPV